MEITKTDDKDFEKYKGEVDLIFMVFLSSLVMLVKSYPMTKNTLFREFLR